MKQRKNNVINHRRPSSARHRVAPSPCYAKQLMKNDLPAIMMAGELDKER